MLVNPRLLAIELGLSQARLYNLIKGGQLRAQKNEKGRLVVDKQEAITASAKCLRRGMRKVLAEKKQASRGGTGDRELAEVSDITLGTKLFWKTAAGRREIEITGLGNYLVYAEDTSGKDVLFSIASLAERLQQGRVRRV
jgi:hypothetical protein